MREVFLNLLYFASETLTPSQIFMNSSIDSHDVFSAWKNIVFGNNFIVFFLISFFIGVGVYIFTSLLFRALGSKASVSDPNLAWIPGIGPLIVAFKSSKMHWWPWLLLLGAIIPILGVISIIIFNVFTFIWNWKLMESIGRPGWWALTMLFAPLGIVIYCIAAWGKN